MKVTKYLIPVLLLAALTVMTGCSLDGTSTTSEFTASQSASNGALSKSVGKALLNDSRLTTDSTDQSNPAIAFDTNNNQYLTVWTDLRNSTTAAGNFDIYGRLCNGSGTGTATALTCSAEFAINTDAGAQSEPKVAYSSSSNRYLVIWTDMSTGSSKIVGQFVSVTGALLMKNGAAGKEVFDISTHNSDNFKQGAPDLTYIPSKNIFVAAWIDKSTLDTSANTANITSVTGIGCSNSSGSYSYLPPLYADYNLVRTIEINPSNGNILTRTDYSAMTGPTPLEGSGNKVNLGFSVPYNESSPKVISNLLNGDYYVAWSGMTHTVTMTIPYLKNVAPPAPAVDPETCSYFAPTYSVIDDDDGKSRIKFARAEGVVVTTLSLGSGFQALYPTTAYDPNINRLLVAWEDNQQIFGQLFDARSFQPYYSDPDAQKTPIKISVGAGARTAPAAAFDNVNQRYLVAWEDARNQSANISNIDIYSQFIDPQGNLSGGNTLVTVASGNQLAPAVAFGDSDFRMFMITFGDGRNPGNKDIYAQLLEYSINPQLTINNSTDVPITSGSVDFGNVSINDIRAIDILLRNDGNAPLEISSVVQPDLPYSITTPTPTTIAPGISIPVTIQFAPKGAGSFAGTSDPLNKYKVTFISNGGNATLYFNGNGVGNIPLTIDTTSIADVKAGDGINTRLIASGGVFPYTWSSTALPSGLTFNETTGVLSGAVATPGKYDVIFTVKDAAVPAHTVSRTLTLNIGVISINDISLKAWTLGRDYGDLPYMVMTATGTTSPVWTISSGTLPDGITLDPTSGKFTGIPIGATGTSNFKVLLTDGVSTATKDLSIIINKALTIQTAALASGVVGSAYNQTVVIADGTAPITRSITAGVLPPGLQFDTGTGQITGTPTVAGTYSFDVRVVDVTGSTASANNLTITVAAATSGGGGLPPPTGPDNGVAGASGGGGCFIATAAYGSYLDPHVMTLRHFRDNVLLKSSVGRSFVKFYYAYSPPVADFIRSHETLRTVVRIMLTPIIVLVKFPALLPLTFFGLFAFAWKRMKKVYAARLLCTHR